jgi:DNA-binding PadR family transcriptional regulator
MTGRQLTQFEHIVLGLICAAPSSGYDLKRIFATTPMGAYQPSSGTLYPALRRLEQRGLVQAQAPPGPEGQSARHRRAYEPAPAGRAAHLSWLRAPVEPATISRDLGPHLMRFAMMEHLLPPDEVVTFLQGLADALTAAIAQLERYTAATAGLPDRHPRLALGHGMAIHLASLRWAEQALTALSEPGGDDRAGLAYEQASSNQTVPPGSGPLASPA